MRAFNVDADPDAEIVFGREDGGYGILGADGRERGGGNLGETVTEVRPVEWDGDPTASEIALGGRRGAVRVVDGAGRVLLQGRAGARVQDLGGVDLDADGRDELLVATEDGRVRVLSSAGRRLRDVEVPGRVERIASAVSPLRDRLALVVTPEGVFAHRLVRRRAPGWYSPAVAGLLGVLAVWGTARALSRLPAPPSLEVTASAAPAARAARAETARARVESLVARGVVRREDAAGRLAQIAREAAPPPARALAAPPPPPAKRR
jgi:hypothetical protein